eukprot:gene7096-11259_t
METTLEVKLNNKRPPHRRSGSEIEVFSKKPPQTQREPIPELETIKLEEILSQSSEKELFNVKTPRTEALSNSKLKSKEELALNYALRCVYSPLITQISEDDEFKSVLDPQSIIETLLSAFPEYISKFENIWNEIVQNSTLHSYDYPIESLKSRLENINDEMVPFYSPFDFKDKKEYKIWKEQNLETTNFLLKKGNKAREENTKIILNVKLSKLKLTKKNVSNLSFLIKGQKTSEIIPNSEWSSEVHQLILNEIKDLRIELQSLGYFSASKIGFFVIDISNIIDQIKPKGTSWGKKKMEETYQIIHFSNSNQMIGTVDVSVELIFQKFQKKNFKVKTRLPSNLVNYLDLYEILELNIVKAHKYTSDGHHMLNFNETWVLEEFSKVYGIGDIFKKLVLLRGIINRIDLLATPSFARELTQCIEFLHTNKTQKYCISTTNEETMIDTAVFELSGRIEEILSNYMNYFPENYPNGILTSMIQIFRLFKVEYEAYSPFSFKRLLQDCITKSIVKDYESIKEEMISGEQINPPGLLRICEMLQIRIQRNDFSISFPKFVNYDEYSLEIIHQVFKSSLEEMLQSKEEFNSFQMIQLCSSIVELNNLLKDKMNFISKINPYDIGKKYIANYSNEIKQKVKGWIQTAISIDKFDPPVGFLHSTSVTDSFELLSQVFDYLKTLEFDRQEIMKNFFDVAYYLAVQYATEMKDLLIVDITMKPENQRKIFNEEDDFVSVTEEVLIKMNNICSTIDQLMTITDYFFSTSYQLDLNKTIDSKESESIHSLNDIIDETITILANKFENKIQKFFMDFGKLKEENDIQKMKNQTIKFFQKNLIDELTPKLSIFSERLLPKMLKTLIQKLFLIFMNCFDDAICRTSKDKHFISRNRLNSMEYILNPLIEYFHADEKGASKKMLDYNKEFIVEIIRNNNIKTDNLINNYKNSTLSHSKMKKYHLFNLLDKRRDSNDAISFYKANLKFNKFRDDFGLEEFENVISMYSVSNNDLIFGKLYICTERICYVSSLNKKKKTSIEYKNIQEIKKINTFKGKGIYIKNKQGKEYKIYNKNQSKREQTLNDLVKQALEINQKIVTDKGFESPKRTMSLMDAPSVSNFLQNKLGLSNQEKLLYAFPCSQLIQGTLYLFDSYLCFDPNTDEEPLIYFLGDISKIQKSGTSTIFFILKFGETLKFLRFEQRDKVFENLSDQIFKNEIQNEDLIKKREIKKIGSDEEMKKFVVNYEKESGVLFIGKTLLYFDCFNKNKNVQKKNLKIEIFDIQTLKQKKSLHQTFLVLLLKPFGHEVKFKMKNNSIQAFQLLKESLNEIQK